MPIYNLNNRKFNIPDEVVNDFERDNPDATIAYNANGNIYDIPVNKKQGFLQKYPNATLYDDVPQINGEVINNTISGGVGTQEEADRLFELNAARFNEKDPNKRAALDMQYNQLEDSLKEKQGQQLRKHLENSGEIRRLQEVQGKAQVEIDKSSFFDRFFNAETRAAVAARDAAEEALETYSEAKQRNDGWFDKNVGGALRGFFDKVGDLRTWDFGASGVSSAVALKDASEKLERGESLTPAEQNMLDAYGLSAAVQAAYQDKVGTAYRVGGSLPESLAFGASLALNPAGGVGKKIAETAAKAAVKKYGTGLVSKLAKGAARVGGDIVEMGVATAIPGAGRVAEDYYNRLNGQATFDVDNNGIIRYGGQVEQEEADDAIWKAFGSQFIENYSESMGNYFAPMGTMLSNLTSKGLKAGGLGKLAEAVSDISSSQWSKGLQRFKDAVKFDGLVGEYLEEVAGNFMNAATVGDMNFNSPEDPNSVFNPDTNIETFLSCALLSGTMYAVEAPITLYNKHTAKKNLRNADNTASSLLGNRWEDLRNQIDSASPEHLAQILTGVQNAEDLNDEQKQAVKLYASRLMQSQGFNARNVQNAQETTSETNEAQNAYNEGSGNDAPQYVFKANRERVKAANALKAVDGNVASVIDTALETGESVEVFINSLDENVAPLARDYYNKSLRMRGVIDGVMDRAEDAIAEEEKIIRSVTDPSTGMYTEINRLVTNPQTGEREAQPGYVVGWIGEGENRMPTFLPEGAENIPENRIPLKPTEFEKESIERLPMDDVISINAEMIRERAKKDLNDKASMAEQVYNYVPKNEDQVIGADGQVLTITGVTPDGIVYISEQGNVNQMSLDEWKGLMQAQLDAQEQIAAEEQAAALEVVEEVRPTEEADVKENLTTESRDNLSPVEEVAQAQAEVQAPVIPTKEDGSIDFVSYGKEGTFKTLGEKYGEKMPNKVAVTAKALADDLAKAQKKLDKAIEEYDNAPIGREKKAEKARDKAQQELDAIKREADFWAEMDAEIKDAQFRRASILNPQAEVETSTEPMNADEFVAQQLASGNIVLNKEDYKSETGYGDAEANALNGGAAKVFGENGMTIQEAGERLMEMDRENGTNFFDQNDSNAGRDALISLLGSVKSRKELNQYIASNRSEQAKRESEGLRNELEKQAMEANYASLEDYVLQMEAAEMEENPFRDIDVAQIDAIFVEAEEEYQNYINNEQGRTSEVVEGDNNVLPEEQADNTGGTSGVESEGNSERNSEGTSEASENTHAAAEVELKQEEGETTLQFAERAAEENRRRPLRKRAEEWSNTLGVKVTYLESIDDVDAKTRAQIEAAHAKGSSVPGWVNKKGEVFFFMPDLSDLKDVDDTYIHEVVAHVGLPQLLGKERFGELCDKVWEMMPQSAKDYYMSYPGVKDHRDAADEYIAHLAEQQNLTPEEKTIWDNIVKMFREMLDKALNGIISKSKLTDEDISNLIKASYANLKSGAEGVSGEGTRFSAKKKRALETVSASRKKHHQTAISSADGAKILNNLDNLAEKYENDSYTKEKTFIGYLSDAIEAVRDGSNSRYATFETKNGKVVTIRLADHNATVSNFDYKGEEEGISIIVTSDENYGIINDGNAHIVEFYYNAMKLRRADGKPLAEIVKSIKQSLYSGEYKDTTGLAERQEVNESRFRVLKDKNELVAVHNISEENLRKVLEIGGLIMPSIAITKADMGHEGYGEISLLFDKETINPTDRRNKVYGGDAWTPRFPSTTAKINDKVSSKVYKKIKELIDDRSLNDLYSLSAELHADNIERTISDRGVEGYYNKEWMKLAYLLDNGKKVKIPMKMKDYGDMSEKILEMVKEKGLKASDIIDGGYKFYQDNADIVEAVKRIEIENKLQSFPEEKRDVLEKLLNEKEMTYSRFDSLISSARRMEYDLENGGLKKIIDRAALRESIEKKVKTNNADYNKWVDNLFDGIVEKYGIRNNKDWYTPSGNLRPWEQLYDNATPANILKYMLAENEQGGSGGFFDSNIMGASAETYESIEEIREKGKKRLRRLEDGEYDEWSNSISERMSEICNDFLSPSQRKEFGAAIDAKIDITNAVAKDKTADGIYKAMKRKYPGFKKEHAKKVEEIVKEIQDFAIGYFEAKPRRIVPLSEVRKAIVPKKTSSDIVEGLKNNGIEVATYKNGDEAARTRLIKKESNGIRFRISNRNQEIFVSNAQKAVEGIKQEKGTPQQWLAMIEKNGGLKAAEDKWLGLSDWLKGLDKKSVTKEEILDFIGENKIQIEEVHYASRRVFNDEGKVESDAPINSIRLNYTTEGLDNKQEIALTVPTIESWNKSDEIHFGDAGEGRAIAWIRFGETIAYDEELNQKVKDLINDNKLGSDEWWAMPLSDRAIVQTKISWAKKERETFKKRVLVIDEIQSKRHQEGREKGYTTISEKEFSDKMNKKYGTTYFGWQDKATSEEWAEYRKIGDSVPSAPFEKNWSELAFKRMLRYAAENGFDKVAWTTGEQQAERYNLGGVVSSINYFLRGDGAYRVETYGINGYQIESIPTAFKDAQALADVFGKELATKMVKDLEEDRANVEEAKKSKKEIRDKIRELDDESAEYEALLDEFSKYDAIQSKADEGHVISGDGLRVGGEGMKGFYDKMLPSFVNKYVKKWGAKVQDIELPNVEEAGRIMHSVDVTEAMKESVMEGQTMFRISEKGKQIQTEVDKFTSKYNSKPVRIVEAEMDDNELMEALDNAFELEDVKSFMAKSKTAAGYFHNLDKIIIFADRTKVERMEEYLFHENIHAAIHHNNFSNLVAHFYEYAKDKAVFEKWSKLAHNKEYKQYNSSEEFLAYVLSNAMVARNLDDVAEYLEDKQKESLNKLFNVIGYDYDIRRRSNEQSGNGRTGEGTPGESSLEGDELLNTGEGRGIGEGTGEGKGRKISPKERKARLNELFGKVADMGLQGVLGDKEYTSLMMDIYKALPEEVRADIAEDAIRLYGGSVAPAVSDYIGPKSKNSIMDKVVTIVREALRKVGFDLDLNANEVRYMAWRSKKPLDRNNMLEVAEDIDMKYRLKVGEYDGTTPDGGGTKFRVTPKMDAEYMEAVNSGDMDKAQRMVDKSAKSAGYTIRAYHGTNYEFNVFDKSKLGNKNFMAPSAYQGFFAAKSEDTAKNYTGLNSANMVSIHLNAEARKNMDEIMEKYNFSKVEKEFDEAREKFFDEYRLANGYKEAVTDMVQRLSKEFPKEMLMEIENHLASQWNGRDSGDGESHVNRMNWAFEETDAYKEFESFKKKIIDEWSEKEIERLGYKPNVKSLYLKIANPLIHDFKKEGRDESFNDLILEAKKQGKDGCIFKNVKDGADFDDIYVVFENTQLKSADAVTYDDNGNVIPLSERFNPEEKDIRFRVANKLQVRDEYEATIKKGGYQAREAVQDAMLSLRKFQELIEKASGKKIRDFENAWMHENRLSSVVQAEIHDMERKFYKPMMDAVKKLMKAANLEQEQVADYLMLKHGIERNREMAVRKALTDDKGKIDRTRLEQWYQDKRNVRNRAATPHLDTWRKQQEELDNIALLYGADMSRDYSGLTSMFGTDDLADSTQKAYDEVEALENAHPVETESLGKAIKAMTQNTLDKSFESGLMDRKVYDELSKDMYDYYIPLRGFEETTSEEVYAYLDQDRGAFNAPLKRAKGRSSKSDNPIAYLKSIAESGIMQGNRNKMKQSFLNMVINNPSDLVSVREGVWVTYNPATGEWEAATPPAIPNDATPADVEAAMEAWEQQMEQAAQNDPTLVKKVAEAADVPYRVVGNKMDQHQIIVKRLGKSYTLTINGNPRLAMALNGQTNPNNTSNDGKVAAFVNNKIGALNRSLAAWYTTRNPDFVASNFMRDTFYTNTIVRAKEGNKYANKFHKNYGTVLPQMLSLFSKYEKGTLNPANKTEAAFLDFMMNGGETGYSNLKDVEEIKKQIAKELKGNRFAKVEVIAEKLDILNRAVENTARFAAYLTSREVGRSIAKSIYDAKEISVNFNKKGAGGTFFGMTGQTWFGNLAAMVGASGRALYVFFNAAVQGSTNLMHVMKVNPKGTSAGLAAMFLMGAVVPFLFGGDDDDEKDYYDLPEHVRRNHLIIPGAGDAWISIPLPIEYRIMYGMGELLTSWRTGHERGTDIARKMLSMSGQALPLNFLEEGLEAFVPSAVSPIYQVMTNSSWTGLPIYKENDFNKDDPEYTKAYSNVDRNLLKFTKALYEWSFDEENQKERIDLNPAVIETLAKGYFGGLATQLSNIAKVGGMIAGEQEFDWRNIPIGNRILKTGDERTKEKRVTNEYFENMEKLDFLQSRERMLKKTEKGVAVPEADKFKAQKDLETMQGTEVYKKYQEFKKQKKVVDKIRKTIKEKGSTPEREKQLMEAQEAANKSVR